MSKSNIIGFLSFELLGEKFRSYLADYELEKPSLIEGVWSMILANGLLVMDSATRLLCSFLDVSNIEWEKSVLYLSSCVSALVLSDFFNAVCFFTGAYFSLRYSCNGFTLF